MKVFMCKRDGGYSGGLAVVAANTKDEAFEVFHSGQWKDMEDKKIYPDNHLRIAEALWMYQQRKYLFLAEYLSSSFQFPLPWISVAGSDHEKATPLFCHLRTLYDL